MKDNVRKTAQSILDFSVGLPADDAVEAHERAFATLIGGLHHFNGLTLDQALETLDTCHDNMRAHISAHWGGIDHDRVS